MKTFFNLCLFFFADFGPFFDLENDLPDELIRSDPLGLTNGGDLAQLTGVGMVQDAASKHKQLSELLRSGGSSINMGHGTVSSGGASSRSMDSPVQSVGSQSQQNSPSIGSLSSMVKSPLTQGGLTSPPNMGIGGSGANQRPTTPQSVNPQKHDQLHTSATGLMPGVNSPTNQAGMSMNANMNPALMNSVNTQGMIQGQVMNGSLGAGRGRPNVQYSSPGMSNTNNLLAESLSQGSPQMAAGLKGPQPGALSKVRAKHFALCTLT